MFRSACGHTTLAGKCFALTLCLVAVATAGQPAAQDTPGKNKGDVHGDALPHGALARLGTLRWRHAETIGFVAFLPDGKAVLTGAADSTLRLWDRDSGKELHRFTVPGGQQAIQPGVIARPVNVWGAAAMNQPTAALSKDGKTLAAVVANNAIQLWEVATGKELRKIPGPQNGVATLLFSPDGKMLAAAGGDRTTYLLDPESGKEIRQLKPLQPMGAVRVFIGGFGNGATMAFAPDSKTLATTEIEFDQAAGKVSAYVKLTDVASGNENRRIDMAQSGAAGVAYSPDGKVLAFSSGGASIHFVEPGTGKPIREINATNVNAMVFAPDSKTIATKAFDNIVRLWDAETGKEIRQLGEPLNVAGGFAIMRFGGGAGRDIAFSADGKTIAIGAGNTVRMWDAGTGKEKDLTGGHRGPVSVIGVSADGKTAISRGADSVVRRWDMNTGEQLAHFEDPRGTTAMTVSPDGKTVAFGLADATIRVCDAATGKATKQLQGHANGTASIVFSSDGKTLASHGLADNTIRLHDPIAGTQLRQIALQTDNPAAPGGLVIRGGFAGGGLSLAFSPDSRTLVSLTSPGQQLVRMLGGQPQPAGPNGSTVRMWDVATAKEVRKFVLPAGRGAGSIALSPDGRVLATENGDRTISLWEIASGKERALFGKPDAGLQPGPMAGMVFAGGGFGGIGRVMAPASTLAFSPDGTLLAAKGAENSLRIWEVAPAKEIGQFKGHEGPIAALAFTPDGKAVATGSNDTTVLVWNIASLKREPTLPALDLPAAEAAALWADLIADDGGKAFQGILKLARAPNQAVPLLRDRVKPAIPVDPKKVAKLIADLDSEEFEQRSAGAEELEKLGDLAVPALEQVLKGQPTLETRRRVEQLLARLTGGALTAEQVRLVRAVEVLERAGTPEARQSLQALADGAPGALATRQAQAVLSRQSQK